MSPPLWDSPTAESGSGVLLYQERHQYRKTDQSRQKLRHVGQDSQLYTQRNSSHPRKGRDWPSWYLQKQLYQAYNQLFPIGFPPSNRIFSFLESDSTQVRVSFSQSLCRDGEVSVWVPCSPHRPPPSFSRLRLNFCLWMPPFNRIFSFLDPHSMQVRS